MKIYKYGSKPSGSHDVALLGRSVGRTMPMASRYVCISCWTNPRTNKIPTEALCVKQPRLRQSGIEACARTTVCHSACPTTSIQHSPAPWKPPVLYPASPPEVSLTGTKAAGSPPAWETLLRVLRVYLVLYKSPLTISQLPSYGEAANSLMPNFLQ